MNVTIIVEIIGKNSNPRVQITKKLSGAPFPMCRFTILDGPARSLGAGTVNPPCFLAKAEASSYVFHLDSDSVAIMIKDWGPYEGKISVKDSLAEYKRAGWKEIKDNAKN